MIVITYKPAIQAVIPCDFFAFSGGVGGVFQSMLSSTISLILFIWYRWTLC